MIKAKVAFLEGRLFSSQSGLLENFSDCSDWLNKSRPSKKATLFWSCKQAITYLDNHFHHIEQFAHFLHHSHYYFPCYKFFVWSALRTLSTSCRARRPATPWIPFCYKIFSIIAYDGNGGPLISFWNKSFPLILW